MSVPPLQPPPDPDRYDLRGPLGFWRSLYSWMYDVYRMLSGSGTTNTWATTATAITISTDILEVTAACTITIPTAVGRTGDSFAIANVHAGVTTLAPTGTETLWGETSQTLTGYATMDLYSNGTNWGAK